MKAPRIPERIRVRGAAVLALAAAAMILIVVAAGCGSSSSSSSTSASPGGSGTVTLWHGDVDVERAALEGMAAQYNAANPPWKVQTVFSGNSDYALQKLLTAMAGGKAPDMMYQYGSSLPNLARSPKIVTIGDLIAKTPGYDWNDFFPAARLACTVDGKIKAVPSLIDNLCLVYNKKLFDQAGVSYPTAQWTWADFRAAAKKLTNASVKQYGWAYVADGSEDTVWRYLATLWQANGDLLNADNTKAAFDSPAGLASMTLLHDMAVVDKSVYLDTGNGNYLNLFNNGKIAMLWTGPWDMSTINTGVQYGVQILPADVVQRNRLERGLRWLFTLSFAATILALAVVAATRGIYRGDSFEIIVISIVWLTFIVVGPLLAAVFRRAGRQSRPT
jgi:multiple sugar transport system substrate-binding protein